jgi:glucose-1-phosphate adenylyltransferase
MTKGSSAMIKKEWIAMLLAGGEGRRLGLLTQKLAKPAVHYGGKYRIIDFSLSNCTNSGIDTVGVLTQYHPLELNRYIGIGKPWDLDRKEGGVSILPPHLKQGGGNWYSGTADAIYQNIDYIEQYEPEYVLVLSGDHIYKMDYSLMLEHHKRQQADVTIAVIRVKPEETHRFGIMSMDEQHRITDFAEKPEYTTSDLASMGVYIFSWHSMKRYLARDADQDDSTHDFGKDLIPAMLRDDLVLSAYPFDGYWRDVGTIESLWQSNMDLLEDESQLQLHDRSWRIYSVNPNQPAQYISASARVQESMINEGCAVFGEIHRSVLFYGVQVGESSIVRDSVIMPNVRIGNNVRIYKAVIGEGTVIESGSVIGSPAAEEISVIGNKERIIQSFHRTGA